MSHVKVYSILAVIFFGVLLSLQQVDAKPFGLLSRQKRISDQRLAELETLIALAKMKGKYVTIPVGFGRTDLDPIKLGRKKRSIEQLIRQLSRDYSSEENPDEVEDRFLVPVRNESEEKDEQDALDLYNKLIYNDKLLRTNFNELPK